MARIIKDYATAPEKRWAVSPGPEVVVLALDKDEALAIRVATQKYRKACRPDTHPTSFNGAGGRVFDAIDEIVKKRGWS